MTSAQGLKGRTILVTRTRQQASEFASALTARGASVLEIPTIEIVPRIGPALDQAIESLDSYDWLFFTSVNSVQIFFDRLRELGKELTRLPRICSIGPATSARVEEYGFPVALQPNLYQAEGILDEFSSLYKGNLEGLRVLLPRASVAREVLPETLRDAGVVVDLIPVYNTALPEESRRQLQIHLDESKIDLVTFTSSSTVRNFVSLAGKRDDLHNLSYAAIGPITAATAEEYGLPVVLMPGSSTIPDFLESIENYFEKLRG